VDGYIARHYTQKEGTGAILEPARDKLLLVSGHRRVGVQSRPFRPDSVVATGTIIGRDLLILMAWWSSTQPSERSPCIRASSAMRNRGCKWRRHLDFAEMWTRI